MNLIHNKKGISMKKQLCLASLMLTAGVAGLLLNQHTLLAETIAQATTENENKENSSVVINSGEILTLTKVVAIT